MTFYANMLLMVFIVYCSDSVMVVDVELFHQDLEFCRLYRNVNTELNRYFFRFQMSVQAYFREAWPQ